MNRASESGAVQKNLVPFYVGLALLCYLGLAMAQSSDPCFIYPHQSVNVPIATATSKLVAGVLGKQIYVCRVTVAQIPAAGGSPAPPGLTLSYGEVVAATPCATSTPGATLGVFGATGQTSIGGDGGRTLLGPVPAAAGTPVVDLCGLVATANVVGATLDYVQVP